MMKTNEQRNVPSSEIQTRDLITGAVEQRIGLADPFEGPTGYHVEVVAVFAQHSGERNVTNRFELGCIGARGSFGTKRKQGSNEWPGYNKKNADKVKRNRYLE